MADNYNEKIYTPAELARFDGEDGPIYIAYRGIIYDVSACPRWRRGMHENLHFPGIDLTSAISEAPHQEEVFNRPCVRRVGRLIS